MADNYLAQVPRRMSKTERGIGDVIRNYLGRLQDDFTTSGQRAGQGLGQVIESGNYLEGVPRVVLGGLGAIGAPVSAAVSPVLGPLLQPVGEAVDTYVGQPIERGTGYPADITNEVFLGAATAGMAPFLKPALKGTGNFLAKAGDAVEGAANRAGYTFRPPEGTFFSGAGPVRRGGGDLQFDADGNQLLPFADETNIPSKEQYRAQHQAYMQRALRENVPDLFYHGSPEDIYARSGFRLNYGEDNVPAVWATSNPLSAEDYARGAMSSQYDEAAGRYPIIQSNYKDLDASQGGVYGLKPTYENPMFVDMDGKPFDGSKNSILKRAKEAGHDAVVFRNAVDNLFPGGVPADVVAFLDDKAFVPSRSGAGPVKLADEVPSQITLSKNPAELKKIYGKQDIENTIKGTGNTRVFTIKRNDGPVIGSVDGRIEGDAFTVDLMAALQGERSITYAEMRELGRQMRDELPPSVQYIQGMRGLQGLSARGKAGRPGLARVALKNLSIPALAALLGYQIIDSPEDDEGFTPAPA